VRLLGTGLNGLRLGLRQGLLGGLAATRCGNALGGDRVEVFTAPAAVAPCVHSHRVHLLSTGIPRNTFSVLRRGAESQQI
jgi:hypothetical protein